MSCFTEVAAEITEQYEAIALANHKANQLVKSSEYCEDCGIDIPAERLAAVITIRCVDCQSIFETKKNKFRGA